MFATRADQENLAYTHQAAAATKPLNQTKTPGNKTLKTPFRGNKQDENNVFGGGKTGLKTGGKPKQNLFTDVKKGNDFGKDAFITPAGPRTRAPLGAKTTNARGNAFQTPGKGSVKSTQKPVSPRLRRPKVKIHQAESVTTDAVLEEPDIEYMPPKSVPLPDYPDDFHNLDYSTIFNRETMISDLWSGLHDPIGADGKTQSEREDEESTAAALKRNERKLLEAIAADPILGHDDPRLSDSGGSSKGPSTLASKTAAAALSKPAQIQSRPHFAAPTAATKARAPLAVVSKKQSPLPLGARSANTTNHAVAAATSKSTLGYSKGRAVSASARKPVSEAHRAEVVRKPAAEQQKTGLEYLLRDDPELEEMLRREIASAGAGAEEGGKGVEREDEDEIVGGIGRIGLDGEDVDELKDFQLEVPEF